MDCGWLILTYAGMAADENELQNDPVFSKLDKLKKIPNPTLDALDFAAEMHIGKPR